MYGRDPKRAESAGLGDSLHMVATERLCQIQDHMYMEI